MNKRYLWRVLFVVVVLSVSGAFWIINKNDKEKEFDIAEEKMEESIAPKKRDLSWVDGVHADMLDDWKSGDKTFDERLVQEVMLKMTYQKLDTQEKKVQ